ncbi:5-methyltetrahydropteroyltriglutamate--homocysteine S-methyltransferase [Flaviflexus salsibiostraticola]|uniref:5-methyltetrahydropteroyltriglutamate--homocysteine S-methyltransferase n=1 Tax=Flaviflexus salsibiostraticola TaxID=1282737 RepID=A0A3Q8WTT2_9ACTO|nr:5-methyltetrahydropteroyltriglutamate--homocysteine S-methyltransferase [Flaviflexus salsibiostraticola]AZN30143.1 5-methyltetrahydropteroyltriglutamate--homocysteine S-methyltransferase [Flaviflexus salsibiostraticola]
MSLPSTILGYPRIGRKRELKKAVESYWAGGIDADGLAAAEAELRRANLARLVELGLGADDSSLPENSSLYDQVLDVTHLLGAAPERFAGREGLDLYFALARGDSSVAPLEMTKWFDTNYHYLVPEIGPDTPISFANRDVVDRFTQAKGWGYTTRPVIVGPVTYLVLSKPAGENGSPLDRLDDVVAAYGELLTALAEAGAQWVQFDEPALVSDNLTVPRTEIAHLVEQVWTGLAARENRPNILLAAPYGDSSAVFPALVRTGVEAIGVDLDRGTLPTPESLANEGVSPSDLAGRTLVAGVVDGRNIWATDLSAAAEKLEAARGLGADVLVGTATSLQHVPHDTALETWDDPALNENLHAWLAFADQKVGEVVLLDRGIRTGLDSIRAELDANAAVLAQRAATEGVSVPAVRERVAALTGADRTRGDYAERRAAQAARLGLPDLPTTSIGSFPQTAEVRQARAAHARGDIDNAAYEARMKEEIERTIRLQEELDVDVLVHGEAERNDMVQYFAELFDGFAVTKHGWVQSYGSRCTRPSILWGDVAKSREMTVPWWSYAQSLTDRPVKGMLTGPVTIIAWSFVRRDIPLSEVADQIALALRDEVAALEEAGAAVIQVDEPALRELLPLDQSRHADYLAWSVGAFNAATAGVEPATQIHTHLCYSEFGQIIDAIAALDADVTSIEAARSRMEVLPDLKEHGFAQGVGPGVWDIHSPRVPSVEELTSLLELAVESVDPDLLWVNPDCGLKTRGYEETIASLTNLVAAAKAVRATI